MNDGTDNEENTPLPHTISAADRTRAGRLRAKSRVGAPMEPADIAWLARYEDAIRVRNGERSAFGASKATGRTVKYEETEHAQMAVGTGGAAETAAAAAMVREEGRRLDLIIDRALSAYAQAVSTYEKICTSMLAERRLDADVQRALLESVRTHYLARAEAESELIRKEAESDEKTLENAALGAIAEKILQKG